MYIHLQVVMLNQLVDGFSSAWFPLHVYSAVVGGDVGNVFGKVSR